MGERLRLRLRARGLARRWLLAGLLHRKPPFVAKSCVCYTSEPPGIGACGGAAEAARQEAAAKPQVAFGAPGSGARVGSP